MSNLHGGCGRGSPPVGASPSIPQPLCKGSQGTAQRKAEPSRRPINAGCPHFFRVEQNISRAVKGLGGRWT
jgi:hypothetical protein